VISDIIDMLPSVCTERRSRRSDFSVITSVFTTVVSGEEVGRISLIAGFVDFWSQLSVWFCWQDSS
jgi:hypothetical protein